MSKRKNPYHINFSYKKSKHFDLLKDFFEEVENEEIKQVDAICDAIAFYEKYKNNITLMSISKTLEMVDNILMLNNCDISKEDYHLILSKIVNIDGKALSNFLINPNLFLTEIHNSNFDKTEVKTIQNKEVYREEVYKEDINTPIQIEKKLPTILNRTETETEIPKEKIIIKEENDNIKNEEISPKNNPLINKKVERVKEVKEVKEPIGKIPLQNFDYLEKEITYVEKEEKKEDKNNNLEIYKPKLSKDVVKSYDDVIDFL